MALELDHVFVCVDESSRAEFALAAFGLDLSTTGIHSGQGTRNACAFFDNAYLEILRRHDDAERRRLTAVILGLPAPATLSAATRETCTRHGVEIVGTPTPHLELVWDNGRESSRTDFSDVLPLSNRW